MKISVSIKLTGIALLLVAGLGACDKPGPAETAGKQIDQTVGDASRKINESADKVAEKVGDQKDKVAAVISDAEMTTKVKAAIFAEPGLRSLQIGVETLDGKVTLTGTVDSSPNSDLAKVLAGAVSGVKEVKNLLVIKSKN